MAVIQLVWIDAEYETFVRSALKPFQAISFISSGALEQTNCGEKGLAITCGSHIGTATHAREAFKIIWNAFKNTFIMTYIIFKYDSFLRKNSIPSVKNECYTHQQNIFIFYQR